VFNENPALNGRINGNRVLSIEARDYRKSQKEEYAFHGLKILNIYGI
jgi:hypothetical protein